MAIKKSEWGNILLVSNSNCRAERFYYLGFSLGKIIDLGNVINTVRMFVISILGVFFAAAIWRIRYVY